MKKVVISVQNGLLAEGIAQMLRDGGAFEPYRSTPGSKKESAIQICQMMAADLLLAEVSYASGATIDKRLKEVKELRKNHPACKIAFLCDENSSPEIAREVMTAKKDGLIDGFFYSSVTAKYLAAALESL